MKLSDFDYELPENLIAQTPLKQRDKSRLMIIDKNSGHIKDAVFSDIISKLGKNDVLVLNQTKVINARIKGYALKEKYIDTNSGLEKKDLYLFKTVTDIVFNGKKINKQNIEKYFHKIEIFLHKQIGKDTWNCLGYPGKRLKPGIKIYFYKKYMDFGNLEGKAILKAKIIKNSDYGKILEFNKSGKKFLDIMDIVGEIPLPPYIKEKLENPDRYQTVYNKTVGSVAAPTAGLHFTEKLLNKLEKSGVKIERVLLHVGLGTFINVQTKDIENHKMHSEYIELKKDVADRLNRYKSEGKNIISVGTTSTRVLESFSDKNGVLEFGKKETDIFIYPGYKWKFIDNLITNFHLPKSTLLMLVSSFAGNETIKKAYSHAIKHKYRFFSFGDAMLIK